MEWQLVGKNEAGAGGVRFTDARRPGCDPGGQGHFYFTLRALGRAPLTPIGHTPSPLPPRNAFARIPPARHGMLDLGSQVLPQG